ncbi:DUF2169 domain-containing protein [Schlegelella sp. S2-27]|uniref:DUF2169 domain-containing protein n=1 Tax=Caldimonas mangrovi TaxID=2944811 RepID=A0ABT0YP92_9BURK|nr:DUF2169 domain-containing protein [Caldimonas mangrovi]MCM5680087.1 DUF2169 domain-containing protein [Caldimonas mangrovi]
MWQLDNRTPFAADRAWVRDRDGTEIWLVAVKASFTLQPDGRLKVADEQPPVTQAPRHNGKPGGSSLQYDTDLPRTRLTTDVILNGCAHAPRAEPVASLDVGLAVGPVVKMLRVFGDRIWQGRSMSSPRPFTAMPLVYERAYGGRDARAGTPEAPSLDVRNPVGTGWIEAAEHADGTPLPNVEDPRALIRHWNDRPAPAGFGAIACHWQPRASLAGTYDDHWEQTRLPLLPDDFDDRHYQCAPLDQQAPQFLRGGEPVTLRNLTLGGGDVRFHLPRVHLAFETFFRAGEQVAHAPPRLHTVILEPGEARVSLVWHTSLPCHPKVLKLQRTRIRLKQDLRDGILAPQPIDGGVANDVA